MFGTRDNVSREFPENKCAVGISRPGASRLGPVAIAALATDTFASARTRTSRFFRPRSVPQRCSFRSRTFWRPRSRFRGGEPRGGRARLRELDGWIIAKVGDLPATVNAAAYGAGIRRTVHRVAMPAAFVRGHLARAAPAV